MNILIIGGTGVLSAAVVNEALKQGFNVTMINRGHRAIPDGVELIKADMSDKCLIATALSKRKFDAVIDFLCFSEIQTKKSFNFYSQYTDQYFYISSCAVYDTTLGGWCSEDSPKILSIWKYSVEKWASEEYLMKLAADSKTKYTIIRPCVTYGDTRIPYGIAPAYGYHWTLIARILNNKPLIRWNGGVNCCNMMRVEDFAVGVIALVGNSKAYNEAFNVCGDEMPTFNDVLGVLRELTNHDIKIVDVTSDYYAKQVPSRAGEILGGRSIDSRNKNDKIKSVVPAFHQSIFLKEGIKMTYDAYKNNNYQYGIDWNFDGECDRVIYNWCKKCGIDSTQYNLNFVDYLGNATVKDRDVYYRVFHSERLDMKIRGLGIRVLNKLRRLAEGE